MARVHPEVNGDGPQANSSGEAVEEATEADKAIVEVGAGDDGLSFDPAAMRISSGTTVTWEWTGEGGAHNVASTSEAGVDTGDSQSDFYSGDPQEDGSF